MVRRAAAATETAVTSSPSIRRPLLGAAVSNTPPSSAAAAGRVCPPLVSPSPAGRAVGLPPALSPAGLPPSPACGGPPAVLPLSALLAAVGRLLPLPQEAALSPSQLDEGVAREQLLVNLSATAVLQAAAAKICRFGGGGGLWAGDGCRRMGIPQPHLLLCTHTHPRSLLCLNEAPLLHTRTRPSVQAQGVPSRMAVTSATFGSQRRGCTTSQYQWWMFVSGKEGEEGRCTHRGR